MPDPEITDPIFLGFVEALRALGAQVDLLEVPPNIHQRDRRLPDLAVSGIRVTTNSQLWGVSPVKLNKVCVDGYRQGQKSVNYTVRKGTEVAQAKKVLKRIDLLYQRTLDLADTQRIEDEFEHQIERQTGLRSSVKVHNGKIRNVKFFGTEVLARLGMATAPTRVATGPTIWEHLEADERD